MNAGYIAILVLAAIAEIVGCYLSFLWLRREYSAWLLVPAALCLILFAWLLAQTPEKPGRTYALYGIVYVAASLGWLWVVDDVQPMRSDLIGVALAITGMIVIVVRS